jgi:pimeloyl-ACP methyl ester carboxylesterase
VRGLYRIGLWACLILALGAGCAGARRPDLQRLYAASPGEAPVPPVIIVPGILGSRLRDSATGEELWPGSPYHMIFSPRPLALEIDPTTLEPRPDAVIADDLFRSVLGTDIYGAILGTLEGAGGYVRGRPGEAGDPHQRRYYIFPYDWRQDNVVTARRLDELIEQIRRDYHDPQLRVDVVAHSMGGLIARYYLQYGTTDVLGGNEFPASFAGAAKLRTVLLLGTPNLGSVSALHSFLTGYRVGPRRIPTESLATMPSVYQLLPHPINTWIIGADGKPLERDLFFAGTWLAYRWSVFDPQVIARIRARFRDRGRADAEVATLQKYLGKRLERARRFVWSLSYNETERAPVKLVVLGGDCTLTPARVVVEAPAGEGGEASVRLYPKEIRHPLPGVDYMHLMLEPGDGSVTKPSLLARESLNPTVSRSEDVFFPLAYSFFLCEDHEHLTGNINFQDNLLNVLLSREHPWELPLRPGGTAN